MVAKFSAIGDLHHRSGKWSNRQVPSSIVGKGEQIEVLLVHPSGNYNRRAPWGIPKGLPDEGESLVDAAVRETKEETAVEVDVGSLTPLGYVEYTRSRKRIHAFAAAALTDAAPQPGCWEVDRAEFLPLEEARRKIHPDQAPLLERLLEMLEVK
jgi:predicted NUDIX family NTP pyrophosphohydrolase